MFIISTFIVHHTMRTFLFKRRGKRGAQEIVWAISEVENHAGSLISVYKFLIEPHKEVFPAPV